MSEGLLLDTHALFWVENRQPLAPGTLLRLATAAVTQSLYLSDISLWELASASRSGIAPGGPIYEGLHRIFGPESSVDASLRSGGAQAASTSIDMTIRGIGGHGAIPNAGCDPIVLAALYITQIQTIVSREEDPQEPTVVTVGDIHGGTKRNIFPDEVKLELTVRTFSDRGRQVVVEGLNQMAKGVGTSACLPPEKFPTVTVLENESTPVTYNDPALTARVKAILQKRFGAEKVFENPPISASEDVGAFSLPSHQIPMTYFGLGAADPGQLAAAHAAGKELPGPHTNKFLPDPEPTIATGVQSLTTVATSLLQ